MLPFCQMASFRVFDGRSLPQSPSMAADNISLRRSRDTIQCQAGRFGAFCPVATTVALFSSKFRVTQTSLRVGMFGKYSAGLRSWVRSRDFAIDGPPFLGSFVGFRDG